MTTQQVLASIEETRLLARIVKIDDVIKHPNADKLSLAIIGGWQCVIKLDEFKKGDLGLYIEIDSLVPVSHPTFSFLEERKESLKSVGEKVYSRIKTIKLRKEISQGLLLQIPDELKTAEEGYNATADLGILKYESTVKLEAPSNIDKSTLLGKIAAFISGPEKTNLLPWPSFLKKSEQERIQNLGSRWQRMTDVNLSIKQTYERSVKLNGQSVTVYSHENEVGVCIRNHGVSLVDDNWGIVEQVRRWCGQLLVVNRRMFRQRQWVIPEWQGIRKVGEWIAEFRNKNQHNRLVSFPRWKTGIYAKDDHVVKYMYDSGVLEQVINFAAKQHSGYMFQGELCGPGIQGNYEEFDKLHFFVYKVAEIFTYDDGSRGCIDLMPEHAREITAKAGLNYVPVLDTAATLVPTISQMLTNAEGVKFFTGKNQREGEVWKNNSSEISFKVISNLYLLNEAKLEE